MPINMEKISVLSTAKNDKLSVLQPRILDSLVDADSGTFRGSNEEARFEGFDAYEVQHTDKQSLDYFKSDLGIKKMARQTSHLANELGVPPSKVTPDMVYKEGEKQKLDALYTLMGRPKGPDGKEWTPGPINYSPTKDGVIHLGSRQNPLGLKVQTQNLGKDYFGRDLTGVADVKGKLLTDRFNTPTQNTDFGTEYDPATYGLNKRQEAIDKLYGPASDNTFEKVGKAAASGAFNLVSRGMQTGMHGIEAVGDMIGSDQLVRGARVVQKRLDQQRKDGTYDKYLGYDPTQVEEYGKTFSNHAQKGEYWEALKGLASDPESAVIAFAQSGAEMAAMMTGVGLGAVVGINVNNNLYTLEQTARAEGRASTGLEKGTSVGLSVVTTLLDKLGDKAMTGSKILPGKVTDTITTALAKMTTPVREGVLAQVGGRLAKAGIATTEFAGRTAMEGATEGIQTIGENKASDVNKMNMNLSQEEIDQALQATGVGLGAGATGTTLFNPSLPIGIVKNTAGAAFDLVDAGMNVGALGKARENVKTYFGTEPADVVTAMPKTFGQKKAIWDQVAVDDKEFAIPTPEEKDVYTNTLAQYAIDAINDKEGLLDSGYRGAEVSNIFTDAANKIAKVHGLDTEEDKVAIQYMMAEKAAEYVDSKDSTSGESMLNPDQKTGLMESIGSFIKGNKAAESVMVESQKAKVKRVFDEMSDDLKSTNTAYVEAMFGQSANAPVLKKLATMSDEQYATLQTVVQGMKVLGSEEAIEDAKSIETKLNDMRSYALKVMGSQDNHTDVDGTTPTVERRTFEDVADDVETMGFLGDAGRRKSIKEHTRELENYVGTGLNEAAEDATLNQLQYFVNERSLDKVHIDSRDYSPGSNEGGRKINSLKGIRDIVTSKIKENALLLESLKNTENKTWKAGTETKQSLVTGMTQQLKASQADHIKLLNDIDSKDPLVRKSVYTTLNSLNEGKTPDALNASLDALGNTKLGKPMWDLEPGESEVIDFGRNVGKFTKGAKSIEELLQVAKDISVSGLSNTSTADDLKEKVNQLQKALDGVSKKKGVEKVQTYLENTIDEYNKSIFDDGIVEEEVVTPTPVVEPVIDKIGEPAEIVEEEPTIIDEPTAEKVEIPTTMIDNQDEINDHRKIVDGEIAPDTNVYDYAELNNEAAAKAMKEDRAADYLEKLKGDVDVAIKYATKLDGQIDESVILIKELQAKSKELRDVQVQFIKKLKEEKAKIPGTMDNLLKARNALEIRDNKSVSIEEKVRKLIDHSMKNLKRVVAGFHNAWKQLNKRIDALENNIDLIELERADIKLRIEALGRKITGQKAAKKVVAQVIATSQRRPMEQALGGLVVENKSKNNSAAAIVSLSTKGAYTDVVAKLMEIMPRVITSNIEYGTNLVTKALETTKKFADSRLFKTKNLLKTVGGPTHTILPATQQFAMQHNSNNPLTEIMVNGEKISFMDAILGNEELAKHVLTAMNISSIVTLKDILDTRTLNSEAMEKLIEGSFSNIFTRIKNLPGKSVDEKGFITMDAKNKLTDLVAGGKIVPESTFTESAGQFMLEQLELRFAQSGVTILDKDKLIKALGVLVINNILPTTAGKNTVARSNARFDIDTKTVKLGEFAEGEAGHRILDLSMLDKYYKAEINDAAKVFEYASSRSVSMISDKPIKAPTEVNNGAHTHSESQQEYLDAQGAIEWKFSTDFTDMIEAMTDTEDATVTEQLVEALLGKESALVENYGPHDFQSALAKYESERLVIERMVDTYRMVGSEGFYIGWNSTVSGRSMMDSTLLNMQASGISRFVVHSSGMVNDINPKAVTEAEIDHVEMAISQAFDIDPAKQEANNVLAYLHDNFVQIVKEASGLTLKFADTVGVKSLQKLVEKDTFELNDLHTLEGSVHIGSKTILHVEQAVQLLRKISQNGTTADSIKTTLALEADGITNGMAWILQQLGLTDFTKEMLAKAGVYVNGSEYTNHGAYKEDGNEDIYETSQDAIRAKLEVDEFGAPTDLLDLFNNALGKVKWRNLLKEPVMTFIYGSGMSTIRENLAKSLVLGNGYMSGGLSRGMINELMELAGLTGSPINVTYKKYSPITKNGVNTYELIDVEPDSNGEFDPKFAYMEESDIAHLIAMIDAKIGKQFAEAFEETFEPIIKFRQTLKTIEQMNYVYFSTMFKDKINEVLSGRLVQGTISDLTQEELLKIRTEMVEEGTWYSAKGAEGTNVDYFKKSKSDDNSYLNESISVSINTRSFRAPKSGTDTTHARTYNVLVQQIAANVGAIGVTTTHNQDGSVMIITGKASDVLNIYDAVMMGTNLESNTAMVQSMNDAFYKVGMENSMIGTAISKMMYMKEKFAEKGIPLDTEALSESFGNLQRIFTKYLGGPEQVRADIEEAIKGIVENITQIDTDREGFRATEMLINQYTAGSDIAGTVNSIDDDKGIKLAKTMPEGMNEEDLLTELNGLLAGSYDNKDMRKEAKERREKATVKAESFSKMMTATESELNAEEMYNAMKEVLSTSYNVDVEGLTNDQLLDKFTQAIKLTC